MKLETLVTFLDRELKVADIPDTALNGLQVANRGTVRKVCCGVDASLECFEAAHRAGAQLLICHHGISWGDSLKQITGLNYRRLETLLRYDLALYACHLPLDAHRRWGNNAQLCRALRLRNLKPFGHYHGVVLGYEGLLPKAVSRSAFHAQVAAVTGSRLQTMDFGPARIRRVAVVSGGAAAEIEEAGRKGVHAYVSGEPALQAYALAQEYGVNGVFAGHYATEVFGVRALAGVLARRFGVTTELLDFRVPY